MPITIGTAFLVAVLQTQWYRSGDPARLRVTRFFGNLLLINAAIGVVTGLVQEFQFGMDWAAYSRFVGDVFGAPLAVSAWHPRQRLADSLPIQVGNPSCVRCTRLPEWTVSRPALTGTLIMTEGHSAMAPWRRSQLRR